MNPKVVILLSCVALSACVKIPSILKKCDKSQKDFSECLRAAIEGAIGNSKNAVKEIGLLKFDPMEIPALVIAAGTGPVAFEQKYKDMKIVGFSESKVTKADMDFDKNVLKLHGLVSLARADFQYEVDGKVLVLPLRGKGHGFVEMHNVEVDFAMTLEEYQKKGKTHYKVTNNTFVMEPRLFKTGLENLFDGDKAITENVNTVLNENWQELWADVKSSYEELFGNIFSDIFNRVLAKVSKDELFGDP